MRRAPASAWADSIAGMMPSVLLSRRRACMASSSVAGMYSARPIALSHECSTAPVLSVSGKSAKQCIPSSGKCGGSTTQCTDDSHEDNDTLTQVKTKPGLPAGTYQLKSCPGAPFDDEDWYPIDIASESTVTATLSGGASSNLDLMLKDSTGKVVVSSAKPGSQESVTSCLTPGRYYFHVWAWSKAENSYSLTWSKQNGCTAQCVDDSSDTGGKNDDNKSQARDADITSGPYKSAMCSPLENVPGEMVRKCVVGYSSPTQRAAPSSDDTGSIKPE